VSGGLTTAEKAEFRTSAPGVGGDAAGARRRRRRTIPLLAAAVVLTAASTWLLYGSSWLRATTVKVSGTRVLTPAQVRAAADVPLGEPLVSVDTDALANRVRTKLRRVDSVDVSRSWPHTVILNVTERTPSVLLPGSDGTFTEVDDEGVRYATVTTAPKGVPLLTVTPDRSATPSTRFFGRERLLRAGAEVAEDLPSAVRANARIIRVAGYDSITVTLTDGRTVTWGSPEQGARKATALTALLNATKGAKETANYDISAPSAPALSAG
jgi:cell division protein FtsQ